MNVSISNQKVANLEVKAGEAYDWANSLEAKTEPVQIPLDVQLSSKEASFNS